MCKDSSGVADLTSGPHKLKVIYTLRRNTVPIVLAVVASFFCFFFGGVPERAGDEHVEGKKDI